MSTRLWILLSLAAAAANAAMPVVAPKSGQGNWLCYALAAVALAALFLLPLAAGSRREEAL